MTETYHFEPTSRIELRERLDERGEDMDEIDHEDDLEDEGYPENDNLQML